MLRGDTDDLPPALTTLSTTGVLSHEASGALYRWIDASVSAGLVVVSKDQYRTLSLRQQAREILRGRIHDLQIRRQSVAGLSAARCYHDDRLHAQRADLRYRRRAGRFGPWDTDSC